MVKQDYPSPNRPGQLLEEEHCSAIHQYKVRGLIRNHPQQSKLLGNQINENTGGRSGGNRYMKPSNQKATTLPGLVIIAWRSGFNKNGNSL